MIKQNFVKYMEEKLKAYWELPALSDNGKPSISYQDLAYAVSQMHRLFQNSRIKSEDKIALIGKNCTNWAIVYLSIVTYGATAVPILNNFSNEDLHHILNHSDSRLIFASDRLAEEIDLEKLKYAEGIILLNDFSVVAEKKKSLDPAILEKLSNVRGSLFFNRTDFALSDKIPNSQIASILYTSGTTGFSKGVMLPYNSIIANILVAVDRLLYKTGANMVSFLPLAHAYACSFDFLYPLSCGNHIHFMDKLPTPKILLDALAKYKPNVVLSVPLIIEKIYRKTIYPELQKPAIQLLMKFSFTRQIVYKKIKNKLMEAFGGNIREIVIGGAAMNREVESFLREIQFPFTIGYGMTECGPLISYDNWDKTRLGSSGKIVSFLQAKNDSTDPVNIVGEILIKGEQLTTGYYKNPEATKDAIDSNGWLHTGDLGVIDRDNYIYVRGRSKNVIIGSSGENIYPEEIEQKINNLPYIQESLVLDKDDKLYALVYPDLEELDKTHTKESKLKDLMEKNKIYINEQLPAHSKIKEFKLVNEPFQKTPTQKIKRYLYIN